MFRTWWPLQSAIAFIMTRDQSFADEIALADGTDRCIKHDLMVRVTYRALVDERPIISGQPADAETAWLLLRSLIADERVNARGTAVDNHLHGTQLIPLERVPGALPPEAVEHLVLWDSPSGETWLAPDGRMCLNGQGRYWKQITVHGPDLQEALETSIPTPKRRKKESPQFNKVVTAFNRKVAGGTSAEDLLSLGTKEFEKTLTEHIVGEQPDTATFGRAKTALRQQQGQAEH